MIDSTKNLHFRNDNLAIFDSEGRQLPQYQRRTLTRLLLDCERYEKALREIERITKPTPSGMDNGCIWRIARAALDHTSLNSQPEGGVKA